ncbi:MAG TPA: amidohydrolase family protein [Candidatus Binatia bacterium]|jgi:imidazolonepropionase-like amidohydrolase|nr:amidohydrolase family protein [Candidatus Binatia bacterium]
MSTRFQPARRLFLLVSLCVIFFGLASGVCSASDLLPPGFRPVPLGVHALVGGNIVIKPGEVLSDGTIVIRDGLIKAVGKDIPRPADARVWDMKGTTIYAGFIEPYLVLGATNSPVSTSSAEPISESAFTSGGVKFYGAPGVQTDMGNPGPGYQIAKITPEHRAVRDYSPDDKILAPLRQMGFTTGVIAPSKGVVRGTSALVGLTDENPNQTVLKADVFQHVAFETQQAEERAYPGSLMGVIATVRQSFFDAQHYALDHADYRQHPEGRPRPEYNPALEALAPAADKKMTVAFEPGSALMVERASRIAGELGLEFCLVSCGEEWRRPDLAKEAGATFIVPLDFPAPPKLPSDDDWEQIQLDQLRRWDWAPENAALLRRQGLEIALTTYGLKDKKKFQLNLRLALDRGLAETDALAALTTVPAKLCGVDKQLGTIEAGKLANLTVVEGDSYFAPRAKVREVWIDGRIYRSPAEEPKAAKTDAKKSNKPGSAESAEPAKAKPEPPDQSKAPEVTAQDEKESSEDAAGEKSKSDKKDTEQLRDLQKIRLARSPLEGRGPQLEPKAVLVQGATIWTCGPVGRLENADLLVVGGKIKAVGKRLDLRSDYAGPPLVIDGHGFHVSPGLIDCHSHTAILGAVNENSLPSTAMVRISDVVNSETGHLREQLAGGVTAANLLHGSANPIGGQNCVIKLRDGATPEGLVFEDAPPGIKFALGENVKQSNWGERFVTRFPQTRMGVRTFIANRFTAAQEYLAECEQCKKDGTVPPRRDLELEALGEILQGKRWIHCHSYRQDEILMLIRLMESFGVKIGTFQHVLEGYKLADEIAAHGAGGSTFSDWWAYKFEVYDAIPYNGSLMRERGVVVSFNSDSSELARRLYTEAAKAVKYGATPEVEALKFVTLNPAKQLHIDSRVGSLEADKDADFVVWSKAPLDAGTVCLQTWIDGRKYFDRALERVRATGLEKERMELIAKAKKAAKLSAGAGDSGSAEETESSFFRVSLEHEFDGQDRHCLDKE